MALTYSLLSATLINFGRITGAAYDDVRNDKTDTNWLLIDYEGNKDKLVLTATGSGGLEELKKHLVDSNASFAYARIVSPSQ